MNNSISRAIQQAISYQFQSLGIVCPVPAGTWNATTSYQKLNIVRTAHASYIAKQASLNIEPGVTPGWEDYWQLNASDGTGGGEAFYPDQIYSQLGAGLDGDGNVITATYATKTENDTKVTSTTLQNVVYIHNATQDSTMPFSTTPTENSIVSRDQNGDFTVNTPSADANPATKAYVDSTDESLQADITEAQSDIAALQTQTADLSQSVDDIYTILQQEVYNAQDIEQEYSSRETADGADIIDGALETVKKIQGATVKTTNLIPFPYEGTTTTVNGVTFTNNNNGSVTINGTATGFATFMFCADADKMNLVAGETYYFTCAHGVLSYHDADGTHYIFAGSSFTWGTGWTFVSIYIQLNAGESETNLTVYPMLNEGSSALPYMPYFPGLKNAYFQGLRSTGRNLIRYPYDSAMSYTENGITFTVNLDGSITANGTATASANYHLRVRNTFFLDAGTYSISLYGNIIDTIYFVSGGADPSIPALYGDRTITINNRSNVGYFLVQVPRGITVNNVTVYPMLNYGSSALPYEPYVANEISLDTAIELPAWDSINPTTGKRIVQSNTVAFVGTETWYLFDNDVEDGFHCFRIFITKKGNPDEIVICNRYNYSKYNWSDRNGLESVTIDTDGTSFIVKTQIAATVDAWKAQLAAWNTAGDPLTVCYQTATTTESDISMESRLPAYKNGSETVIQGDIDNSEYGAENTLTQNYAEVKGTTGTTEGGNS